MNKKIIRSNRAPRSRSMGPNVRQVIPSAARDIDPFVFLDHFGPFEKRPESGGVPPHPHAGIATITYLFEGSNRHQDSLGNDCIIHAGDIGWMQSGKGIVHAEGMNEGRTSPEVIHGLQFWISLPAKDKFAEPDFFFYPSEELPSFTPGESSVKVLCGSLQGYTSPVKSLSPAYMFEVKMPALQTIEIPVKTGDTCGLYLISGGVTTQDQKLIPTSMTEFDREGEGVTIHADMDSHFVLFGGTPLDEPIVAYASYVMNSEAQLQQVISDYRAGKMGTVQL
ncbi:MAG: pirin family protein [Bacteroidia bacterium]|nr:pirin family protein [Bacteroidia bacterium]